MTTKPEPVTATHTPGWDAILDDLKIRITENQYPFRTVVTFDRDDIEFSDEETLKHAALIARAPALESQNAALVSALEDMANMPEHDQDDAHRLRHKARAALVLAKGAKS
jgi:hypothetical protein